LLLLFRLLFSPRVRLLAEILFLRRQLALYRERKAKASRPSRWSKLALVWLSKLFDWRNALLIVKPATKNSCTLPEGELSLRTLDWQPPQANVPASGHRHCLPNGYRVTSRPVVGGLHHEYGLEKEAA
jgi:hypothetical protein